MGILHGNHSPEDILPCPCLTHHRIRKHAAVPTNVAKGFRWLAAFVAQPISGVVRDIQFSGGIVRETMVAGFIMSARTLHRAIILSDVKINRPWP